VPTRIASCAFSAVGPEQHIAAPWTVHRRRRPPTREATPRPALARPELEESPGGPHLHRGATNRAILPPRHARATVAFRWVKDTKPCPLGGDHGSSEVRISVLPAVDRGGVYSHCLRSLLYGESAGDQASEGLTSGGAPLGGAAGFPLLHEVDIPDRGEFPRLIILYMKTTECAVRALGTGRGRKYLVHCP
jgi:hypothetical protein